jgi:hypothetical protein
MIMLILLILMRDSAKGNCPVLTAKRDDIEERKNSGALTPGCLRVVS